MALARDREREADATRGRISLAGERRDSAPGILSRAQAVFSDPLMADGSHVCGLIGPAPERDESDNGSDNGQAYDDPHSSSHNTPDVD